MREVDEGNMNKTKIKKDGWRWTNDRGTERITDERGGTYIQERGLDERSEVKWFVRKEGRRFMKEDPGEDKSKITEEQTEEGKMSFVSCLGVIVKERR